MSRHKARQMAIEILFSREFHGKDDIQYQEEEILHSVNGTDEEHNPAVQDEEEYCNYLVTTTTEHMDEFDQIIQSLAKGWDVSQMNRADKNVMRLALCELIYPKMPVWPMPSFSMKPLNWPRNSAAISHPGSSMVF